MSIDLRDAAFSKEVPVALYYQLKESLLQKIQDETWKPGQKIPTERELCEMYGVSRITVRKALDDLQNEGYLYRVQGKGTFVRRATMEKKLSKFYSFGDELRRRGMNEVAKLLSFSALTPEEAVRHRLELRAGEQVFCIRRQRLMDEVCYAIEVSYIPRSLTPALTAEMVKTNGLYSSLRLLGVYPDRAVEQFRAAALTAPEGRLMGLPAGRPAINLQRQTWAGAQLIEYCNSVVRDDFFTYAVELK